MYILTHHGYPISKPHPHRVTCYIEALERGLVKRGAGRYWFWGLKIEQIEVVRDAEMVAAGRWPDYQRNAKEICRGKAPHAPDTGRLAQREGKGVGK